MRHKRFGIGKDNQVNEIIFLPEYKVINDLFGDSMKYNIPAFQRPYSWECIGRNDRNNQVNELWDDLFEYFESKNNNPYFLGSMVLVGSITNREFQVIDGQQRLTTIVLLLVGIKCFLKNYSNKNFPNSSNELVEVIKEMINEIDRLIYNRTMYGAQTKSKKVKIEKNFGYDYDTVFDNVVQCNDEYRNQIKNITEEQRQIVDRYFNNAIFFEQKIKLCFSKKSTEETLKQLNGFIEFIKNRVSIVRILASEFKVAYQIFEILNNRGLPLSNKDLLRNFIISEFAVISNENSEKKWENLDSNYSLDNDFISCFVEAKTGRKQKHSAFNDLKEFIQNKYKDSVNKKKIEIFYEEFEEYLKHYTEIIHSDQIENREIRYRIQLLLNAGNLTYTINVLLALYKNIKSEEKIFKFIKVYEIYIISILLNPAKRISVEILYDCIRLLNENNFESAMNLLLVDKKQLKVHLNFEIKENEVAKLLLAKYFWTKELERSVDVLTWNLLYSQSTLEHIIPQKPKFGTNWLSNFSENFRKEYTYKLGNMTLLTHSMNSSVKNYDFALKKNEYKKTLFPLTVELSKLNTLDINEFYILERHKNIVDTLYQSMDFDVSNKLDVF